MQKKKSRFVKIGFHNQDIPFPIEHSDKDVILKVFDVGNRNSRNDTKKRLHAFDSVNVILFMIDVSEYNLVIL